MRVAIVCPYAWDAYGGVQSHVRALAAHLRERGHETLILAPAIRRSGASGAEIVGRAVSVPANGSIAPISFGPAGAARVRSALARFGPDVVHAHEPLAPSISLLAVLESRAPVVGTFHAAAERSLGYRVARPVLERAAARIRVRSAVSDAARALIARYFPGEYALTPNGVDAGIYADAEPLDLGSGPVVLFFGRLERRKGLEVLLQAMTRLRDTEARLVVAGTGPGERSARALAASLKVDMTWLGRVSESDKARVFKGADVYCAPNLGGESFGIVLVEAMAAGTPIVCSSLPGCAGVAGSVARLVPPGDAGRLADALRAVLSDEDARAQMTRSGLRTAGAFDWRRLTANVEALYDRAVRTDSPATHATAGRAS